MLRVYHASGTRSVRLIWLCFELALTIQITPIDFLAPIATRQSGGRSVRTASYRC